MKFFRAITFIGGLVVMALAFGFIFRVPLALRLWPWEDGRYSYLFIGSILAAAGVAMLWIGWTGEMATLAAGSLNIFVIAVMTSIYFFQLAVREGQPNLTPFGIAALLTAIGTGASFVWSRQLPLHDPRPTPPLVRLSFVIFIVSLFFAGAALILQVPIFPWALNHDSSVVFGCIFIGDAFYFLYGLIRPCWQNAFGQLLSFLTYDLVLIVPFLFLIRTVEADHLVSLVIYVAVLLYSGALAIYFLFIHPSTRFGFGR